MERKRKKTWKEKVRLVHHSWERIRVRQNFGQDFYQNLFFLNKELETKFVETDFEHQNKAIMQGLEIIVRYLDDEDKHNKQQIMRIAKTHNHYNMGIHPHSYYYWVEALVLTIKKHDEQWFDNLEYYWKECISFPINFIISQYFVKDDHL